MHLCSLFGYTTAVNAVH